MIIELNSLQITFNTGRDSLTVLDVPEWNVEEGDRVAVFGPSGSGKSTLLHTLAGLLPASKGEVSVCGQSLEQHHILHVFNGRQNGNQVIGLEYESDAVQP